MSSVPLICERCGITWNYKGKALHDPSKRIHCSKCNSTKIKDTLGNKVNVGFSRPKTPTNQSDTLGQKFQISSQQQSPTNQIFQHQQSPTLDLSQAKSVLGKPIPTVEQIKSQQVTQQIQQPTQPQPIQALTPEQLITWEGKDFKIIYALLDDLMEWTTKNKGMTHTVQRRTEMGELLAKFLNKYGVNAALEIIFVVSHVAYFSPLLFHYYTRKGVKKSEGKQEKTKDSDSDDKKTPVETEETKTAEKKSVETPKTVKKNLTTSIFGKGRTMIIEDFKKNER